MTIQEQYAIDQYNLCCRHLRIDPYYDHPGSTLFESISILERDIRELDNEVMRHRLEGIDELARLERENLELKNTIIAIADKLLEL
jgi:hypothetical protein